MIINQNINLAVGGCCSNILDLLEKVNRRHYLKSFHLQICNGHKFKWAATRFHTSISTLRPFFNNNIYPVFHITTVRQAARLEFWNYIEKIPACFLNFEIPCFLYQTTLGRRYLHTSFVALFNKLKSKMGKTVSIYAPSAAFFDRNQSQKTKISTGQTEWYGMPVAYINAISNLSRGMTLYFNTSIIDCSQCFYCKNEYCEANKYYVSDGVLYCDYFRNK